MPDLVQAASQKQNASQSAASLPKTSSPSVATAEFEDNSSQSEVNRARQNIISNTSEEAKSPAGIVEEGRKEAERGNQADAEFDISEIPEDYNPDKFNLEAEKKIDPKSEDHRKNLATLETSEEEMGNSAQINLQGELTLAAKLNRFFNKESTYSILQRKAEEFNKETDVVKKQSLLKELKPLAQLWLEKHDTAQSSGDKEDSNEKLKRESVYKFLNQTTSNFPEIMKVYATVQNAMNDFKAAPVEKRSSFHRAVSEYKKIDDLITQYKKTYPPAVNLLYFSELKDFNKADDEILKSAQIKGSEFDTKLGFSVKETSVSFDLITETIEFSGNLNFTIASLTEAEGHVIVTFNSDESFKNIEIEKGKFAMSYNGIALDLNFFTYDYNANKFSIKKASGSTSIFDKKFTVTATNLTIIKQAIDFDEITGKLPAVDVGFFGINETEITYDKQKRELIGKTKYNFNTKDIPKIEAVNTEGDLEIHWHLDDPTKRYYDISEGTLSFKLYDQSIKATGVSYNSKNSDIESENIDLTLNVPKVGEKTISGKNIKINNAGLDFTEITTKADVEPIKYSIFTIVPEEYILIKDKNEYRFKVAGAVTLTLPEFLGIKSDAKIDGNLGVNLSNSASPTYDIGTAKATFSAKNPLTELSSLLGGDASKGRYEIVGGFPVFPGVNAEFGAYLNYGADFGKSITASISWLKESEQLVVDVGVKDFEAKVGAGLLAGIGVGLSLIAALQLRLKAGAEIDVKGALGYQAVYDLTKTPSGEGFKSLEHGLTYDLGGGLNMKAFLEIVATALYFFQKSFEITIASKELGSFEISDKEKFKFITAKSSLATKEQLEEHIDEDKKEEYKESKYNILDLLSMDFTKRFASEDKSKVIETIENDDSARLGTYKKARDNKNNQQEGEILFNYVPLEDLHSYETFINNRCSWEGINDVIDALKPLKPQADLVALPDGGKEYLRTTVRPQLEKLASSSNMTDAFVQYYEKKVKLFKEKYKDQRKYEVASLGTYISNLEKKHKIFKETNEMKRNVHSQRKGDEQKQEEQVDTSTGFLGLFDSNYESFREKFDTYASVMKNQQETFEAVENEKKVIRGKLESAHNKGQWAKK